jgi:hypothetical protein
MAWRQRLQEVQRQHLAAILEENNTSSPSIGGHSTLLALAPANSAGVTTKQKQKQKQKQKTEDGVRHLKSKNKTESKKRLRLREEDERRAARLAFVDTELNQVNAMAWYHRLDVLSRPQRNP